MTEPIIKSIAVFIPHLGCPHKCTFCNQNAIASTVVLPDKKDIENAVMKAVNGYPSDKLEIAFFGGSFTCISETKMREYLQWAQELVEKYSLYGIRFSTRPDGISEEIMDIISSYDVMAVELGAQSMDNTVLETCERGHTAEDTVKAAKLIKEKNIQLVLQMMTGLPGSSSETDLKTAERISEIGPDAVRIYPAIVFENTKMCEKYVSGDYVPQTLEDAVLLCKKLLLYFESKGISVIKLGLNAEKDFDRTMIAGPYHPAFRELVEGEIYFEKIREQLIELGGKGKIYYHPSAASKIIGHKKMNKTRIFEFFGKENVEFICDKTIADGYFYIK